MRPVEPKDDKEAEKKEKFKKVVNNTAGLVIPGGFLVLQSALGADCYYMGEVRFPSTNVNKEFLIDCINGAGLVMVEYKEFSSPTGGEEYGYTGSGNKTTDHKGVYSLVAKKPK